MGLFSNLFRKDKTNQTTEATQPNQTTQTTQTTQNNPNNKMNQDPKVPEEVQRVNEVLQRCGSVMALVGAGLVNPETKELYSGYYIEETKHNSGEVSFKIKLSQKDHLRPRGTITVFSTGDIRLSGNSFAFDGVTRNSNIIQSFNNYGLENYRAIEFYNDQGESTCKIELSRDCQEIEKVSYTRSKPREISQREELDISKSKADIATLDAYDIFCPNIEVFKESLQAMQRDDDSDYANPNQRRWQRIGAKICESPNMDRCLMYLGNIRRYPTTDPVQIFVAESQRATRLDQQLAQGIETGVSENRPKGDDPYEYDFG